jgi:hypothetical protein
MINISYKRLEDPRYRKALGLIKWRKIVRDGGKGYKFYGDEFYYEFCKLLGRCSYCEYHIACKSCELKYDSLTCEALGHPYEDWFCDQTKGNAQAVLDLIKKVKVPKRRKK